MFSKSSDTSPLAWWISLMLLFATMLNYMDRQTLANVLPRVKADFELNNAQAGNIESWFSLAFAFGSLTFGILVDRVSVRWLYPAVLTAWSAMGLLTGLTSGYQSLLICRTLLGFFEAGHWPCALTVTHAVLSRTDRTMGNSILQSGASLGAILTPLIILAMIGSDSKPQPPIQAEHNVSSEDSADDDVSTDNELEDGDKAAVEQEAGDEVRTPGAWRMPFIVIGAIGIFWCIAWLKLVPRNVIIQPVRLPEASGASWNWVYELVRNPRFWALVIMVFSINAPWQLIRYWMPTFLQSGRGYSEKASLYFSSVYYIASDVGCILSGAAVLWLARRGTSAHSARITAFGVCAALTALTVVASFLPQGWPLLGVLLIVAAGSLGLFPCYYSMAQEIDSRHVGKVTGVLGFIAWTTVAPLQTQFGKYVDATGSFDLGLAVVGCVPFAGLLAVLLLWKPRLTDELVDQQAPPPDNA